MASTEAQQHVEAIWRIESARVIAGLARILRDVGLAEELAQDALVAALEQWPKSGIPDKPGAWLMATAKHRAIDLLRRRQRLQQRQAALSAEVDKGAVTGPAELDAALDEEVSDDLLRLVFIACHPVLSTDAQVALTLRVLGGLKTEEIARAFLVPEQTIAQRIVRAKRTLADARIPFEMPRGSALAERICSVLAVIYLVFNEGYSATVGTEWIRPALCDEALRLGRIVAELAPNEAEVHGLVALMELQASRLRARTRANGEPILLLEQNRAAWDQLLIQRGLLALGKAEALGGPPGPYVLQASIAACHAKARAPEETDWALIVSLYERLGLATPSPVVELNRAVAVSMAEGPAAGLALIDGLREESSLQTYHLLPSVRGDLLAKLGRFDEARLEFERAASLTHNSREWHLLMERATACGNGLRRPG